MRRALLLVVLVAAGCGSETAAPPRPHLPRTLAHSWRAQADAVAAALAAGNGCLAQTRAAALQTSVIGAVNTGRVPPRFQEELLAGVNELAARIECAPPPPRDTHDRPEKKEKKEKKAREHGHGKGKGKKER